MQWEGSRGGCLLVLRSGELEEGEPKRRKRKKVREWL